MVIILYCKHNHKQWVHSSINPTSHLCIDCNNLNKVYMNKVIRNRQQEQRHIYILQYISVCFYPFIIYHTFNHTVWLLLLLLLTTPLIYIPFANTIVLHKSQMKRDLLVTSLYINQPFNIVMATGTKWLRQNDSVLHQALINKKASFVGCLIA